MASTATQFDTDCKLMLHCDGTDASTTFTDSELNAAKTVTANGDAQLDTAQQKFGTASGLFDGTGDYLSLADSTDWDFGTGDLTIDLWIRFASVGTNQEIFDVGIYSSTKGVQVNVGNTSQIQSHINQAERTAAFSWSNDTWYHVAITRSGSTFDLFVDGNVKDTWTNAADITGGTGAYFAFSDRSSVAMNGWQDEIRVVNGTAVWTDTFTPPSAAYTAVSSGAASNSYLLTLVGVG